MTSSTARPRNGAKELIDGAWAGLAAAVVLAGIHVIAHAQSDHDAAGLMMQAMERGVIGLVLGPIFSLLTARLGIRPLEVAGIVFALPLGVVLGQTSFRDIVGVFFYGATLGLVLHQLRRQAHDGAAQP